MEFLELREIIIWILIGIYLGYNIRDVIYYKKLQGKHETPKVGTNKYTKEDCLNCRHIDIDEHDSPCGDCDTKGSKYQAI